MISLWQDDGIVHVFFEITSGRRVFDLIVSLGVGGNQQGLPGRVAIFANKRPEANRISKVGSNFLIGGSLLELGDDLIRFFSQVFLFDSRRTTSLFDNRLDLVKFCFGGAGFMMSPIM